MMRVMPRGVTASCVRAQERSYGESVTASLGPRPRSCVSGQTPATRWRLQSLPIGQHMTVVPDALEAEVPVLQERLPDLTTLHHASHPRALGRADGRGRVKSLESAPSMTRAARHTRFVNLADQKDPGRS
jgi:hypothetical protein